MTELEKAARAAADVLAEYESTLHAFDVEVSSDASLETYERVRGVHQRLRAALEAEAGWETVVYHEGHQDGVDGAVWQIHPGHEYRIQRRPLREDKDV